MNRFLFKGKTKETHKWVYGGICERDGRCFIVQSVPCSDNTQSWGIFEVDPKTVELCGYPF